ncbi:nucleotide exchange factor GrpE [Haloplanus halophilus]|uniref:nucleotide exchange factor GrpE n=1 Tax=Haloplanus halophilus TaxID=2949993 RepID=UPI00203BF3A1|nr:nucleotide exchange factor GrpE [Haloplanus sp. GDY1]
MSHFRDPIVGIDPGTSTTRCAVYDGERPRIVPNGAGREATPTVVSVAEDGTLVAGTRAADRTTTHPERTVTDLVDRLRTGEPVVVDGVSYPPETLAAAVISRALPDGAGDLEKCVLTAPNGATRAYRRRLRDAASILEFSVERTVHSTAAAAMAYGFDRDGERTVLVCDFGGGTADVSVLDIDGGVYHVFATDGVPDFGGADLDAAVADHLASAFADDHGVDLRSDPQAHRRLIEAAADARADLSTRERTRIQLPAVTVTDDGPLDLDTSLSSSAFESIVDDVIDRIEAPIDRVLDAAAVDGVDDVVLAGDATRTPAVRERIEAVTETVPTTTADPGTAAALGAAIQGGVLSGHVDDVVLLDALFRSLGVAVDGDGFEPLVRADTTVPTEASKTFTTTADEQSGVRVRVREGGSAPDGGTVLGDVALTDLPAAPAGDPRIEVTLSIDERRIVNATAACEETGEEAEATFDARRRLTPAAVDWSRRVLFRVGSPDSESPVRIAAARPDRLLEPRTGSDDPADYPPITSPVLPHGVGLETVGDGDGPGFERLLDAGTSLPAQASRTFTTATDDQESVRVRVLREGTSDTPEPVGEVTVRDLPSAPAGNPDIAVDVAVDATGTLTVSATVDDADDPAASTEFDLFDGRAVTGRDDPSGGDDGPELLDRSPTAAEIECLLDVRDDLSRALDADADDPEPVQAGLRATRKKLDRLTDDELTASIAEDALAVADDLDRAVGGDPGTTDRLRRWIRSTRRRVESALDAADATLLAPDPGESIDPDRHSVVARVESERPADAVVDVRATGYARAGRVERPAKVTVSDGPGGASLAGPPDAIPGRPDVSVDHGALSRGDRIGSGGRADVFEATVPSPDGPVTVALKEPRFSGTLHADVGERFVDEARRWARLDDHDHVVGVVDWGAEPLPWIAMEYMDGGTLDERAGDVSVPQALWTALAVARGVSHANKRGVAHLDLKPENVLFRSVDGAWDVPKVADWGLSRHLLDRSSGASGYTPTYAAPEQLDGDGSVDATTDVYQLGAVCYELFTGRPPFEGDGPGDVVEQVRTSTPPPPSDVASVPDTVDDVLLTALATDPADRYESTLYLRDALRDAFESTVGPLER